MSFFSFALVYANGVNKQLKASGANVANFTSSTVTDPRFYQYFVITAIVTAVSGTTPTLDLQLQGSPDNSTWTTIDSVQPTQITATGRYQVLVKGPVNTFQFLRINGVIGGTSPSFTSQIEFFAYGPYAAGNVN